MNKRMIFTVTGALVLFAGPLVSPAPTFARQAGGGAPTCEQLASESAALQGRMNGMIGQLGQSAQRGANAAQAAQAASAISGLVSNIPVVGGIIAQATTAASSGAMEAEQTKMTQIAERMAVEGPAVAERLEQVEAMRSQQCGVPAMSGSEE